MKIKPSKGEAFYVDFKYERFPTFCFLCGLIGHSEIFCSMQFEGVTKETVRPFSVELRDAGRRTQPHRGQRWLLPELPRRSTNVDTDATTFTHINQPQGQEENFR
nr:uncharacterized protein LOC109192285 [Ipomoea batatas]